MTAYDNEDIIRWLETLFPAEKQSAKELGSDNEPLEVIELPDRSMTAELSRLHRIGELFEESKRLDARAKTARATRKLNQLARDRSRIQGEVRTFAKRVKGRKRRDEDTLLKMIEEHI